MESSALLIELYKELAIKVENLKEFSRKVDQLVLKTEELIFKTEDRQEHILREIEEVKLELASHTRTVNFVKWLAGGSGVAVLISLYQVIVGVHAR